MQEVLRGFNDWGLFNLRTEKVIKTTCFNEREASAAVFMELTNTRKGARLLSETIQTTHQYQESSEIMSPSSPSYWGMAGHLSTNIEWEIDWHLRNALPLK